MKLLFCEDCGDIIAPHRERRRSRLCSCLRHAVWWEDPIKGQLRLCDLAGRVSETGTPYIPKAFVIGLHNGLLHDSSAMTREITVKALLHDTPDSYVFKQIGSLVVKLRPGMTGDTRWERQRPEDVSHGGGAR